MEQLATAVKKLLLLNYFQFPFNRPSFPEPLQAWPGSRQTIFGITVALVYPGFHFWDINLTQIIYLPSRELGKYIIWWRGSVTVERRTCDQ